MSDKPAEQPETTKTSWAIVDTSELHRVPVSSDKCYVTWKGKTKLVPVSTDLRELLDNWDNED
jgi:hypothetical protein